MNIYQVAKENKLNTVFSEILKGYEDEGRLRAIPEDGNGSDRIDLTSNDYLGLGKRWKEFTAEFNETFSDASFSSSASRLLSRRQKHHESLENLLSRLYEKDVLLFNSGYHANVGLIQALAIPGTIFLSDKLIHASMIDGIRLSGAEYRRWRHNDVESLRTLLDKNRDKRCVVLFESIYSMDGDIAPLRDIVALKKDFPDILIYLDEAHAFCCRGQRGLGIAEETGVLQDIDILIGTLGKAAASAGAFVATSPLLKNYFLNTARSFIFSTALPPVNAAWSELMIRKMIDMTGEREHLSQISDRFRKGMEDITCKSTGSASCIVPLITGDANKAVKIARLLSERGIDALPIRRPTVAAGSERIRFSLSADLTTEDIDNVIGIIRETLEFIENEG